MRDEGENKKTKIEHRWEGKERMRMEWKERVKKGEDNSRGANKATKMACVCVFLCFYLQGLSLIERLILKLLLGS